MQISVNPLVSKTLNSLSLGVIRAGIHCMPSGNELRSEMDREVALLRGKYKMDDINKIPAIAEARKAYRALGNDPNRYRPSADSLLRRIVKGMEIYRINNVVDVLNLISIRSGFSIGGYDDSSIRGEVELGIGQEGEPYEGIGRGAINIRNLPVLRDRNGAFGCPTSDSERSMIHAGTTRIVFVFFDFGKNPVLETCMSICSELLVRYAAAQNISSEILNFD